MNLAEMQRDFRTWLLTASDDAASRLMGSKPAGLSVYQNNYRAQLVGCLEISYPHVRSRLGTEAFLAASITHIDNHPPHAWTLDAYGDHFDETIASLYPHNPDMQELARIELALARAFVARDGEALTLDGLASLDLDSLPLRLMPSLALEPVTTNAAEIWSALQREEPAPKSEMLAESAAVIVWRQEFTVFLDTVDALEYTALLQLQQDGSFGALCTMLVERLGEEEGVAKAGAWLARWIGKGWLAGAVE